MHPKGATSLSSQFTGQDAKESEATVLANYEVGQRLGEGAFGSVYEAKYIPSGQRFALKVLQKDDLMYSTSLTGADPNSNLQQAAQQYNEALERHIIKEATMMQSLQHPHVVTFYKFLASTVAYYFIMDLAEGGELFDLVISEKYFSEAEARNYFQQLISALDYCHRKGVAHKDLKAENLLLSRDNQLLVCDFGFSTKCVEDLMEKQELDLDSPLNGLDSSFQGAGTLHYMSPEAVIAAGHNMYDYLGGFQNDSMFADSDACFSAESSIAGAKGMGSSPLHPMLGTDESWASGAEISVTKKKEKVGFFQNIIGWKGSSTTNAKSTTTSPAGNVSNSSASTKSPGVAKGADAASKKAAATGTTIATATTTMTTPTMAAPGNNKHQDPYAGKLTSATTSAGSSDRVTSPPSVQAPASTLMDVKRSYSTSFCPKIDPFQQDLWSAAVILFFMLTGRLPFNGRDDEETLHLIQHARIRFLPEEERRLSEEVKDLLRQMMRRNPAKRLTREGIIHHPWFAEGLDMSQYFPELHESEMARDPSKKSPADLEPTFPTKSASFLRFQKRDAKSVTAEEETVMRNAFDAINTDELSSGISRDQLRDALTSLGKEVSKAEDVTELMRLLTGDGTRKDVSFPEFRNAWVTKDLGNAEFSKRTHFQLENIIHLHPKHLEPPTVRQLRSAFDTVDEQHTGVITIEQLERFFKRYNVKAERSDLLSLIHVFQGEARSAAVVAAASMGSTPAGTVVGSPLKPAISPLWKTEGPGDYISFDFFLSGIQEALLKHPLGRKLAETTNLTALFHTYNVRDCLWHGFLVIGSPTEVLHRLTQHPRRLRLLHSSDIHDSNSTTFTFRYTAEEDGESSKDTSLTGRPSPAPPAGGATNTMPPPSGSSAATGAGAPGLPPIAPAHNTTDGAALENSRNPSLHDFQARRSSMRASITNARLKTHGSGYHRSLRMISRQVIAPPLVEFPSVPASPFLPTSPAAVPSTSSPGQGIGTNMPVPLKIEKGGTTGAGTNVEVLGRRGASVSFEKVQPASLIPAKNATVASTPTNSHNTPNTSKNKNNNNNSTHHNTNAATVTLDASSLTHSLCEVDVILTPVGSEYVLVRFRRIFGSTNCFHESVDYISGLLQRAREQAMQDTLPRGESELM